MLKIFITTEPIDFSISGKLHTFPEMVLGYFYFFEYRFSRCLGLYSKGYGRTEKRAYNLTQIMSVQRFARFFATEKKGFI